MIAFVSVQAIIVTALILAILRMLAINKLKRGKNDGYDGLTSDYIIIYIILHRYCFTICQSYFL